MKVFIVIAALASLAAAADIESDYDKLSKVHTAAVDKETIEAASFVRSLLSASERTEPSRGAALRVAAFLINSIKNTREKILMEAIFLKNEDRYIGLHRYSLRVLNARLQADAKSSANMDRLAHLGQEIKSEEILSSVSRLSELYIDNTKLVEAERVDQTNPGVKYIWSV